MRFAGLRGNLPSVGGLPQLPLVEVVELVAIVALAACTIWFWRRTTPAALERRQINVERTIAALGAEVDQTTALRATWKADVEGLAATVEDYFGRIEKKRASTAASASRAERALAANAGGVGDVTSLSRSDQIAWARRATVGD